MGQSERPERLQPTDGSSQASKNISLPPASEHAEVPFHVAFMSVASPDHAKRAPEKHIGGNEDVVAVNFNTRTVLVEDGVGGNNDGRGFDASRLARDVIMKELAKSDPYPTQNVEEIHSRFSDAILSAHDAVRRRKEEEDAKLLATDPNVRGIPEFATTVSLAREVVSSDGTRQLVWANVGDSSIRVFRNGELLKVTTAHSAHRQAMKNGEIDEYFFHDIEASLEKVEKPNKFFSGINPDSIFYHQDLWRSQMLMRFFGQRSLITAAVGFDIDKNDFPLDSGVFQLQEGDIVLMYTDGVDDTLTKDGILAAIAEAEGNVDSIPAALVAAVQQKCSQPNAIWDGNYLGDSGRAKPDDITVAAWKA